MDNNNSLIVDPGGDSDNENFVVIEVSDEEFNSAVGSSGEENGKSGDYVAAGKNENSSDDDYDADSDESGIHSEIGNLLLKEQPIQFIRDDVNENCEDPTALGNYVTGGEDIRGKESLSGKEKSTNDSESSSSGEGESCSDSDDEQGEGSDEDSDLYESSSSSEEDSDDLSSDSDSDEVVSDSSDNEGDTGDDSEEPVVSDSDNSDESSEFSGGESDGAGPNNLEKGGESEDEAGNDEDEQNLEVSGTLSDEGERLAEYPHYEPLPSSPEEGIEDSTTSSPEKSDSAESMHSCGDGGESPEDNTFSHKTEFNEDINSGKNAESDEERSPSDVKSPGSPQSIKSDHSGSYLSDEPQSPDSNKSSSDNGNSSSSPGSVQSPESQKSNDYGSGSDKGSPDSTKGDSSHESLSSPDSPKSIKSGDPDSCDPGSPSSPGSAANSNSPRSDMEYQNSSDEAGVQSPESQRSPSEDEEDTLKQQSGDSASPENSNDGSPLSDEPVSPRSNCSNSPPLDAGENPLSVEPDSDGSPKSDNGGDRVGVESPETYPESPGENLTTQSGCAVEDEFTADQDNVADDAISIGDDVDMDDLVEADDEDSQESDESESEQWIDIESENEGESCSEGENSDSDGSAKDIEVHEVPSDGWESYDSGDSCDSEDFEDTVKELKHKDQLEDATRTEEHINSTSLNVGNFEEEGKILLADDDSDNWEDLDSTSEDDSSDDERNDNGDDFAVESAKRSKLNDAPAGNSKFEEGESPEDDNIDDVIDPDENEDWELIDDNNNSTEDENSSSDNENSSSSSSDDAEGEGRLGDCDSDTMDGAVTTSNFDSLMNKDVDNTQLDAKMNSFKPTNNGVEDFVKLKMREYLTNSGYFTSGNANFNEKTEKVIDAKDLAELISLQDNNLNSVTLGPDYEPDEIKGEINRFWKFYHGLRNSSPDLGKELTPFLVPMLIYFQVELISNSLHSLAVDIFTSYGDKFIKEGGDERFIEELTTLSNVKDKAEFEANEQLHSLQERKYSFMLSVNAYEKLTKFLAKSPTPVLVSLFSDRFVIKLKFPEVEEVKSREFAEVEDDHEEYLDQNGDTTTDLGPMNLNDFAEDEIKRVSYAEQVIRRLRNNSIVDMPSVTVYTTNGRPLCGAMSARGTMIAYGMDPAGVRLCKTAQAQNFSDDDKENENDNQASVITLNAHEGSVYDVAFHPKTKLLFSVGHDGLMRAWDLHKDQPANRCIYSGHLGAIWTMDMAPSGIMIATGGMDTTARLWLPERNEYVRLFVGHYFDVDCIKFHPNEAYIATGSIDKSVRLWSVNDGNMVRILTGSPGRVNAIAFHDSGKYIAGGGEDDVIRIWDIAEGELLYELPSSRSCRDLSFHGNKLAGCFDKSIVQIWDLKKLVGGDDLKNINTSDDDAERFYNIFGDAETPLERNGRNGDIIIPAPFSVSCDTEYVFKVHFKDATNVFCLGAEEKPVVIYETESEIAKASSRSSETEEAQVLSPDSQSSEEESPTSPPSFNEFPFLGSKHRVSIESLEGGPIRAEVPLEYYIDSVDAPNAMSADEIDTTEEDTVRAEVEAYDKLVMMTRQDDDTWLTDL